ncbi:hypothetical protein [Catelliglobosispora koreensis]|uniref:hypothetical protein n=1 Tax=Catelliglobosispora koreensis TaxID=129052 RepID=UPI00036E5F1D|nr:hypothetical protein [Catelliglobosispora koreensis]
MGQQACGTCPALRKQVSDLQQANNTLRRQVSMLEQHIAVLHERLAAWRASITAAVTLIVRQNEKPTMPLKTLILALHERMSDALEADAGRRR